MDAAMDAVIFKALDDAISQLETNARTTTASMNNWAALIRAYDRKAGNVKAMEPFIIREEEELYDAGNEWLVF